MPMTGRLVTQRLWYTRHQTWASRWVGGTVVHVAAPGAAMGGGRARSPGGRLDLEPGLAADRALLGRSDPGGRRSPPVAVGRGRAAGPLSARRDGATGRRAAGEMPRRPVVHRSRKRFPPLLLLLLCITFIQYMGWNDVTESAVKIRPPFCGYNLA